MTSRFCLDCALSPDTERGECIPYTPSALLARPYNLGVNLMATKRLPPLSPTQETALIALALNHQEETVRQRAYALLLLAHGQSAVAVARQLEVARRSLYNWIDRFLETGIDSLTAVPISRWRRSVTPEYLSVSKNCSRVIPIRSSTASTAPRNPAAPPALEPAARRRHRHHPQYQAIARVDERSWLRLWQATDCPYHAAFPVRLLVSGSHGR